MAQVWGRSVDGYLNSLGRVTPATQDEGVVRAAQYQREHFHETPALIVACYGGALARTRPDDLAAHALRALLDRESSSRRAPDLDPTAIDDVILGDANAAGEDNSACPSCRHP